MSILNQIFRLLGTWYIILVVHCILTIIMYYAPNLKLFSSPNLFYSPPPTSFKNPLCHSKILIPPTYQFLKTLIPTIRKGREYQLCLPLQFFACWSRKTKYQNPSLTITHCDKSKQIRNLMLLQEIVPSKFS